MNQKTPGKQNKILFVIIVCFAMYLLYGIYFTAFGANSRNMMRFFAITEGKQGMVMTVQSIGCLVMVVLLGLFGERINKLYGLLIGLIIMGAASIAIGTMTLYTAPGSGYGLLLFYALIGGIGYIMIDLLMNGAIADIYPDKKEKVLPYVHAFYGLGAMLAPLCVTALTAGAETAGVFAVPYLVFGIAAMVMAAIFAVACRRAMPETPYADMEKIRSRAIQNPAEVFKEKKAWLFLISCFLYLFFQNSLAVWAPTYFKEVHGMSEAAGNNMLVIYFLGCLVIRLASPLVYKFLSVRRFYLIATTLSAVTFGCMLLTGSMTAKYILIFLTGLLQGSAVPGMVVMCCNAFPERTASASSIVVFGVSVSALIAPPVLGWIIEQTGYTIPMWGICICLLLSVGVLLLTKEKDQGAF